MSRAHPADLLRQSQCGVAVDWPVAYADLAGAYAEVESMLRVSGANDNPFEPARSPYPDPPIPFTPAVTTLAEAARRLGLHPAHAPLAILSRPLAERGACTMCGGCWSGCHVGAIGNDGPGLRPVSDSYSTLTGHSQSVVSAAGQPSKTR